MSTTPTVSPPQVKICLADADSKEYSVSLDTLKKSETLKNMIDDLGGEVDADNSMVIPNIRDPAIWEKVQEYMDYMCEDSYPTSDRTGRIKDFTDQEKTFLDSMETPLLFEVIKTANFLDCKPLLEVGCKAVAEKIKGKTPEEIRQIFGIKKDMTTEEEKKAGEETDVGGENGGENGSENKEEKEPTTTEV